MDIHIRTGALSHAFSLSISVCMSISLPVFSSFFLLYLSFGYLYCIVECILCMVGVVCACLFQSMLSFSVHRMREPIFRWTIRYFANVTLSIRHYDDCVDLALFSNKHAHNSIHHISITFFCRSMRVFHCRPRIFCIFRIFGYLSR